jgi:hypothetical protein
MPAPAATTAVAFPPGPSAANLCKFPFPPKVNVSLSLGFQLPAIPPKLPTPFINIGLSCALSNPFDVAAGIAPGGGRTPNAAPNPDDTFTSESP